MLRNPLLPLLAVLLCASPAAAQEPQEPQAVTVGSRVRVTCSEDGSGSAPFGRAVGASFGALLGLGSGDDPDDLISLSAEEKAAILAVIFTPVGALIGLLVSHGERWQPLATGGLRPALGALPDPAASAPGLCVVLRF